MEVLCHCICGALCWWFLRTRIVGNKNPPASWTSFGNTKYWMKHLLRYVARFFTLRIFTSKRLWRMPLFPSLFCSSESHVIFLRITGSSKENWGHACDPFSFYIVWQSFTSYSKTHKHETESTYIAAITMQLVEFVILGFRIPRMTLQRVQKRTPQLILGFWITSVSIDAIFVAK
jgi:hypothetical protein